MNEGLGELRVSKTLFYYPEDNESAEDNTTIPASNADHAKSDTWNPTIIIIIGICIMLIVFGVVIFVRKKSGSEKE